MKKVFIVSLTILALFSILIGPVGVLAVSPAPSLRTIVTGPLTLPQELRTLTESSCYRSGEVVFDGFFNLMNKTIEQVNKNNRELNNLSTQVNNDLNTERRRLTNNDNQLTSRKNADNRRRVSTSTREALKVYWDKVGSWNDDLKKTILDGGSNSVMTVYQAKIAAATSTFVTAVQPVINNLAGNQCRNLLSNSFSNEFVKQLSNSRLDSAYKTFKTTVNVATTEKQTRVRSAWNAYQANMRSLVHP